MLCVCQLQYMVYTCSTRAQSLEYFHCYKEGSYPVCPPSPAYHHLSKSIEVSRVHLFDIVTQYRAIFPDDDTLHHSSSSQPHLDGALFYAWLGSKVHSVQLYYYHHNCHSPLVWLPHHPLCCLHNAPHSSACPHACLPPYCPHACLPLCCSQTVSAVCLSSGLGVPANAGG